MTDEARLKTLVERVRRNPRIAHVAWDKELQKELARARPEQREAFFNNVERWAARQEEILFEESATGSIQ